MNWELVGWLTLAIGATSVERVLTRYFLAGTQNHREFMAGYSFGAVLIALGVTHYRGALSLSAELMGLLALSGGLWFISCLFSLKADQHIEVSLTSLLAQVQLILVCVGGVLLFGEGISWHKALGIVLILAGLGTRRGVSSFRSIGVFYKVICTIFAAAAMLTDKYLSSRVDPGLIALIGFGLPFLLSVLQQNGRLPDILAFSRNIRFGNVFVGLLAGLFYYALIRALGVAPISLVFPLFQLNLVVITLLGFKYLAESDNPAWRLTAAGLVTVGAFVIQW